MNCKGKKNNSILCKVYSLLMMTYETIIDQGGLVAINTEARAEGKYHTKEVNQ